MSEDNPEVKPQPEGGNNSNNDAHDVGVDEVSTWLETTVKPIAGNLTVGTVMGYCSGTAMKKIGKMIAFIVGLTFIGLQTASSFGYIQIDWNKIHIGIIEKVDTTGDGKVDIDDMKVYWKRLKSLLTTRIPAAGGFSVGFLYGIHSG